jgi:hypothetical protein
MSCIQNKFNFYSTMPPREWQRYKPSCPDTSLHSTNDLNMRRKAEILKYDKNTTNKLTKKQKWAMISRGHWSGKKSWSSSLNDLSSKGNGLSFQCGSSKSNCAYTSASGVPGKKMLLCLNESVPLYMYKIQRTYLTGSYKDFSLFPIITQATFEIDAGAYPNVTTVGTIEAQDFIMNYSTVLTFKILSGNEAGKFSVGENTGIVSTNSVLTSEDSVELIIQVINVFDFTSTETIVIKVNDTDDFKESDIPSFNDYSPWYPPMDSPPIFCEPWYPGVSPQSFTGVSSPEDITVIYPVLLPPPGLFLPYIPAYIAPPIVPPIALCDCYGV